MGNGLFGGGGCPTVAVEHSAIFDSQEDAEQAIEEHGRIESFAYIAQVFEAPEPAQPEAGC